MRTIAVLLATLVALVLTPPSATYAAQGISFSTNGTNWAQSLPGPLFDESILWVPGDVRTSRFYVRNDSGFSVNMAAEVLRTQHDDLLQTGDLEIEVRVGSGEWATRRSPGAFPTTTLTVGPGESFPVDVRVRFRTDGQNQSQRLSLDLEIRVTLSQASTSPTPTPSTTSSSPAASPHPSPSSSPATIVPRLPLTDGAVAFALILTAAVTLSLGILIAALRRRRREEGEHA